MKIISAAVFFIFLFFFLSCEEKVTDPGTAGFSFYSSKCHGGLLKAAALRDSSFEYTFFDDLLIDFTVTGNCCPDSNRFAVTQNIYADTIYISVEDTAGGYCRCICSYHIYARFSDLNEDHYIVICSRKGEENNPLYIENVYRMEVIFKNSASGNYKGEL
jgi:hypothetical protein